METTNQSILTTFNLSSTMETQSRGTEEGFKTGYALIIISVVIVIGNSFVLLTVKSFARRLVADIFISSLAMLDIIHTITSILLAIIFKWTYIQHNKEFGVLCKTQAWFTVTTQIHSAFIVTVINLERLTAVSRPFFYKSYVNTRRAVRTLIILLFVSICVSSLPLIAWGNYVLLPKMALCLFPHDSDYAIFIVVIGYADLLVVSYCFVAIKISLKKFMERQARFEARRGAVIDLQERGVAPKMNKTASKSFIQSQRLLKVTAMVSGLFYFSWLPLMVSITRAQITHEHNHLLSLISTLQPLASPLANPLIYFFTWERYKKSYIRIMKRLMSCLAKFNDAAIFNKGLSSAIPRSAHATASQLNEVEDEDEGNKRVKKQTYRVDIDTEKSLFGEFNIQSIISHEIPVSIPTVGGKLRSYSYDSSMTSRCVTSSLDGRRQDTETKRRYTFSGFSENITVEKELLSGGKVQGEGRTRHKNEDETKNFEEVSSNVISKGKSQYKNSPSIGKLNKKSRKITKPWLSQKLSSENHQKIEECFKINYGENIVDHDEVSVKDAIQLKNYVPDSSVTGNEISERNNSENLADKCLITQRIGQYLTNVINDRDLQKSQKRCNISGKQQEYTKKKRDDSRRISQNLYEYSTSKYQDRKNLSRQRHRRLYSRNRNKYSRKNYWEEFEDFQKKLDDDVRKGNISEGNNKETKKVEDRLHETSDRRDICDEVKGETSDKFILRIFPKSHEYSRHGNKSRENRDRGFQNDSKRRNNFRKRLELKRLPKSKNTEASIWTYL